MSTSRSAHPYPACFHAPPRFLLAPAANLQSQIAYANSKGIEVGGYDLIILQRGWQGYGEFVGWCCNTALPEGTPGWSPLTPGPDACMASNWYDQLIGYMVRPCFYCYSPHASQILCAVRVRAACIASTSPLAASGALRGCVLFISWRTAAKAPRLDSPRVVRRASTVHTAPPPPLAALSQENVHNTAHLIGYETDGPYGGSVCGATSE